MRFRSSLIEKSRMDKANEYLFDKSQKTIDSLKKNLNAERAVKQDAVSRLDDLQSVVGGGNEDSYSYVGGGVSKSRPQTANCKCVSIIASFIILYYFISDSKMLQFLICFSSIFAVSA